MGCRILNTSRCSSPTVVIPYPHCREDPSCTSLKRRAQVFARVPAVSVSNNERSCDTVMPPPPPQTHFAVHCRIIYHAAIVARQTVNGHTALSESCRACVRTVPYRSHILPARAPSASRVGEIRAPPRVRSSSASVQTTNGTTATIYRVYTVAYCNLVCSGKTVRVPIAARYAVADSETRAPKSEPSAAHAADSEYTKECTLMLAQSLQYPALNIDLATVSHRIKLRRPKQAIIMFSEFYSTPIICVPSSTVILPARLPSSAAVPTTRAPTFMPKGNSSDAYKQGNSTSVFYFLRQLTDGYRSLQ